MIWQTQSFPVAQGHQRAHGGFSSARARITSMEIAHRHFLIFAICRKYTAGDLPVSSRQRTFRIGANRARRPDATLNTSRAACRIALHPRGVSEKTTRPRGRLLPVPYREDPGPRGFRYPSLPCRLGTNQRPQRRNAWHRIVYIVAARPHPRWPRPNRGALTEARCGTDMAAGRGFARAVRARGNRRRPGAGGGHGLCFSPARPET